jgi:predicted nucleic acid-binding protein
LSVYLDASVLVSLFTEDAHTAAAKRIAQFEELIVSDLASAEFSSALAIQVRNGRASAQGARSTFGAFDLWCEEIVTRVEVLSADIRAAQSIIRLLQHALKTADATHISVCRRLDVRLATFDDTMAREAARLGVEVASL